MAKSPDSLERLRHLLASDRFPVNSRLPPERQLSLELGVSRSALRDGLAVLEAEGKVWRHVGKGTFVGRRPARDVEDVPILKRLTSPAEVLEARLLLEPRIASLAAIRAKAADIAHMERCLDKLEESLRRSGTGQEGSIYDRWDGTLHRAVAEATHNALLLALFDSINAVRSLAAWGRLQSAALTKERWHLYCDQHRGFVSAIADRDPEGAERAMRLHLETVQSNLLDTTLAPQDATGDSKKGGQAKEPALAARTNVG